ncbi:MAG: CPBP family intramembrane metalloprotease [Deltaproteobacteria bacterium]|nr:CPBP family intramembrane metalloprotease [Deltaproteobacteria bacterium]
MSASFLRRLLRRWLWDQWQVLWDEVKPRPRLDPKPMVVLLVTAVSLTLQEYWGDRQTFRDLVPPGTFPFSAYWELASFGWWSGFRVVGYLVVPMIAIAAMPGERVRDYGLSFKGFRKHAWIYVVLYLLVLPAVLAASCTRPFQYTYPFYKLASRSLLDFLAWELLYGLQFLSLEFFFRGFILFGLRPSLGPHAIWVMCVPYCMIHYGKPMAETLGAIVAGLVLGTLSLRTRSIWCGVLVHVSVALTMDLLALPHCRSHGRCP